MRTWSPTVQAMVERSGGADNAAELRREWEQGLVTLLSDGGVLAVVEGREQPDGIRELAIHAINGKNALPLVRWLCELGRAKKYQRLIVEPRSRSRERLYLRWGRQLKREGQITQCRVAPVNRVPTPLTPGKILSLPTQVVVSL